MRLSTKEACEELEKDRETMRKITQNWNKKQPCHNEEESLDILWLYDKFDVMFYSSDKTFCWDVFGGVLTVTRDCVQREEEFCKSKSLCLQQLLVRAFQIE